MSRNVLFTGVLKSEIQKIARNLKNWQKFEIMCFKNYKPNKINRKLEREFQNQHKTIEQAQSEIQSDYKTIKQVKRFITICSTNWGSARPDNDCVFTANNVEQFDDITIIHTRKQDAPGMDYNGKSIHRAYTSGMIISKESVLIKDGTRISAIVRMPINAVGAFTAFWFLYDKSDSYYEVDVFERPCKIITDDTLLFTTHKGDTSSINRQMYNRTQKVRCQGIFKLYDTCFNDGWVTISINNVPIFKTKHAYPVDKNMKIIFNDAVRLWPGVNINEINNCLPRTMEIKDIKVMQKR